MSKRKLNEIQEPDSVAYTPTGQHYWKLIEIIQSTSNPNDIKAALQTEMAKCRASLLKLKWPSEKAPRTWPVTYQTWEDGLVADIHKKVASIHCIGCSLGISTSRCADNWNLVWFLTFKQWLNDFVLNQHIRLRRATFRLVHSASFGRNSEIDQLHALLFWQQQRNCRSSTWSITNEDIYHGNMVVHITYHALELICDTNWDQWHDALLTLCEESRWSYPNGTVSVQMRFSGFELTKETFKSLDFLYQHARLSTPWFLRDIKFEYKEDNFPEAQLNDTQLSDTQLNILAFFIGQSGIVSWLIKLPSWFRQVSQMIEFRSSPYWVFSNTRHCRGGMYGEEIETANVNAVCQLMNQFSMLTFFDLECISEDCISDFLSCVQESHLSTFGGAMVRHTSLMLTPPILSNKPWFTNLSNLCLSYDDNCSTLQIMDDVISSLATSPLLLQLQALKIPCLTLEQSQKLVPIMIQSPSLNDISFGKAVFPNKARRCACLHVVKSIAESRPCLNLMIQHMPIAYNSFTVPHFTTRPNHPLKWKEMNVSSPNLLFSQGLGDIWWTFCPTTPMIDPIQLKYLEPESQNIYLRYIVRDVEKRLTWAKIGLLISFMRANCQHPFQLSILTLVPSIFDMI